MVRLKSFLGIHRKPLQLVRFTDPFGNFLLDYPRPWRFDRDVVVESGSYAIAFESSDGKGRFNISVISSPPPGFDLHTHVKKVCEAPSSGIVTKMRITTFRGMVAYRRDCVFGSGGSASFASELVFFTGYSVFTLLCSGPEKERANLEVIFNRMLKSLVFPLRLESTPSKKIDSKKARRSK